MDYDLWCGPAPLKPPHRNSKQYGPVHYEWHWVWDYGNGDLGNQGIHQMDIARWGLGVGDIGQSVQSYGGRFGYVDAGETANTQVSVHTYGDKKLVFEVRGLPTKPLQGAAVGVIFYGSEGYLVNPSYKGGTVFDKDGKRITTFNDGDDKHHFANFIKAVRSRKHEELNGDIQEGHISSALCHLANISYRLGQQLPMAEVKERLKSDNEAAETFARFLSHLSENKVDEKEPIGFGETLQIVASKETIPGNSKAMAMLTREYRKPFVVPSAV